MTDKTFFVYLHRRDDTGDVFYVGKGTRTSKKKYIRANTAYRRNIYWKRIVAKTNYTVELVADFFQEEDAFRLEQQLIAQHKRQCNGGTLCNLTEGGEGHAGLRPSPETRRKMSEKAKGKARTEAQKLAVSLAQKGVPNSIEQNMAHSLRMRGEKNWNFGKKNSPETIAKRVATRGDKCSGKSHPFFGKKRPQHVVEKLRDANSKAVIDRATGTIFRSVQDAAAAVGRSPPVVTRWLKGHRRNPTALEYA